MKKISNEIEYFQDADQGGIKLVKNKTLKSMSHTNNSKFHLIPVGIDPGYDFDFCLPYPVFSKLQLDIKKLILPYNDGEFMAGKKFEGYSLSILTVAWRDGNYLDIRKPRISKKEKTIEYTAWFPYLNIHDSKNPKLSYLSYLKQTMILILTELGYSEVNISKIISSI